MLYRLFMRILSWVYDRVAAVAPKPEQLIARLVPRTLDPDRYAHHHRVWANRGFYIVRNVTAANGRLYPVQDTSSVDAAFHPNLFVLGAAKSGTTTLYAHLDRMPEVCMARHKEPFFFECEYELGVRHYKVKYFHHWMGEPIIGEARHRNLYLPYIPERIHAFNPQAKLVVLLRHPVERAYSHWWHYHSRSADLLSFKEAIQVDYVRIQQEPSICTPEQIEAYCTALSKTYTGMHRTYLDSGYYADQLARYLALFPREQIHIIVSRDLFTHPASCINALRAFLDVPPALAATSEPIHRQRALETDAGPRPPLDAEMRAWLLKHYAPHNDRLADMIDHDISHRYE